MEHKDQQEENCVVLEDVVKKIKTDETTSSDAGKRNNYKPRLVIVSGQTEEECKFSLNEIKENDDNVESNSLGRKINGHDVTKDRFRGYSVLGSDIIEIKECPLNIEKRPIWFVFTGMGSHWPGMGKELMQIEPFKESIDRSAKVLNREGVDLLDLVFNSTEATFDNVVNRFIMIVSIQVALVDLLNLIDIRPDGILGISTGELSCAYADGSLTLEQTLLSAYWRGKCVIESNSLPGAMATVALSMEEINKMCPSDIQLAGNFGSKYVCVSGPKQSVEDFVTDLKSKKIFAQTADSAGIAFHSKYLGEAGARLKKEMTKIIAAPKTRSSIWISTSVPEDCPGNPVAQLSSPDYFVHNLLQPIYFLEAMKHIPEYAITIEVSLDNRHWTLTTMFQMYLPDTTTNIELHKWNNSNHMAELLSGIGKLYIAGANPELKKLCSEDDTVKKEN